MIKKIKNLFSINRKTEMQKLFDYIETNPKKLKDQTLILLKKVDISKFYDTKDFDVILDLLKKEIISECESIRGSFEKKYTKYLSLYIDFVFKRICNPAKCIFMKKQCKIIQNILTYAGYELDKEFNPEKYKSQNN